MKKYINVCLALFMILSLLHINNYDVNALESISFMNEFVKEGEPIFVDSHDYNGDLSYAWSVGGKVVSYDEFYTPTKQDINKWIEVTVSNGIKQKSIQTYFSLLPVIYIDIEDGKTVTSKDEYLNAQFHIQGNDEYNQETTKLYTGSAQIKGRGNSTWNLPKIPYRIKLDKSTDLFGYGKNKNWVLLANYNDTTFLRNKLGYDLSGQLGIPYMQSVIVDVVMNGEYIGNYQLCEQIRIDENRVNITNWEDIGEEVAKEIAEVHSFSDDDTDQLEELMVENLNWISSNQIIYNDHQYQISDYIEYPDIDGGYLLEIDKYFDEISKFYSDDGMPVMFKAPEYANTNTDMMNYVKTYISTFEDAVKSYNYTAQFNGEIKHYSELFDVESLINNWIVQELFMNADFMKNSTYLYKNHNELFKMGPVWDLDWTSGVEYSASVDYTGWQTTKFNDDLGYVQWYKDLVKDPYFVKQLQDRYLEVKDTYISQMYNSIDSYYSSLQYSAQKSLDMWRKGKNFASEINELKTWLENRIEFMNDKMSNYDLLMNEFNKDLKLINLYDDSGNELSNDDIYHYRVNKGDIVHINEVSDAEEIEIWNNNILLDTIKPNKHINYNISINENSVIKLIYKYDNKTEIAYTSVFVNEKNIKDIEFVKPIKLTYNQGEDLDMTGASLKIIYEDNTFEYINTYDISGYNQNEIGKQTLTITYKEYNATFDIEVIEKPVEKPFPFEDVFKGQWYYEYVDQAYQLGLMTGASDSLFKPTVSMNRGMVAIVLHRMEGAEDVAYAPIFPDVYDKQYFTTAVMWAKQTGIITGYNNGTFMPLKEVTREEMATMIQRFAKYKGLDVSSSKDITYFQDYADISTYARAPIQWCVENGVLSGKFEGTKVDPLGTATRAECAKMLVQAYKVIYKK